MPQQNTILWADDEIDLLKPHIMFLRAKGYDVVTVNNGADALDLVSKQHFNLIILDENMPGITGLETLARINVIAPNIPVIMITKSEEENIMDQAVGNKIADYLIKPVNPNQILLSIKKNLHSGQLVSEHTAGGYRQDFSNISALINNASTLADWQNLYRTLTHWEIELSDADTGMAELLDMQKIEANAAFCKFVRKNYEDWVLPDSPSHPLMSPDVFKRVVFPELDKGQNSSSSSLTTSVLTSGAPFAPFSTTFHHQRGFVHLYPPNRHTIRPKRHILRTHAR